MSLLFSRIVLSAIILGMAYFGFVKVWTKKVDLVGLLKAPSDAIPVIEDEQPIVNKPQQQPTMDDPKPNIQAGGGSAISVNQQGGMTVGTMNVNTMQPQVEGVRISQRQVPSPRDDAPYAIELVVQVSSSVQPFAVAVVCDRDIVEARFAMPGNSVYTNVRTGYLNNEPKKSYYLSFGSPAITPSSPLLITVMCREPFTIRSVERQSL